MARTSYLDITFGMGIYLLPTYQDDIASAFNLIDSYYQAG
jgi:hypothetical protein